MRRVVFRRAPVQLLMQTHQTFTLKGLWSLHSWRMFSVVEFASAQGQFGKYSM
ncbi:hypothetical protein DPMN_005663 [Dreissena polymorpha]|uniref:Uncharacterized protein n=1 Tax=Dreissena polymorpha TaxID=45954 RepID=A0A9D4MSM4_DREPO|nr:hypothetical protein DPMN_005663 [Dreissena polymorpha]